MPFCPVCKAEFVEGVAHCPDCDVDLVPALPKDSAEKETPDIEFVVVKERIDPVEAVVIKDALEKSDIPVVLAGDELSTVQVYPAYDSKVWVPASMAERAKEIIADIEIPSNMVLCDNCGALVPEDSEVCPSCSAVFEPVAEEDDEKEEGEQ